MQSTRQTTPQFDESTIEYLKYAGAIQGTTAEKFIARNTRRYKHLHPSLRRLETLEQFIKREMIDTVESFEERHRLPKSTTFSDRAAAAHRAFSNMLRNRPAVTNLVLGGARA